MLWTLLLLAQDFSFAPPDATFLASLNVTQVRGMVKDLVREAGVKSPVSWKVLDRVERVQVAIVLRGKEPQMLALLEGQFNAADVDELKRAAKCQGPKCSSSKAAESMRVELLDERRILISDEGMLRNLPPGAIPIKSFAAMPEPDTRPKFAVVHGMEGGPKEFPVP